MRGMFDACSDFYMNPHISEVCRREKLTITEIWLGKLVNPASCTSLTGFDFFFHFVRTDALLFAVALPVVLLQ